MNYPYNFFRTIVLFFVLFSAQRANAQYCTTGLFGYGCTSNDLIQSFSTTGGSTNISNLNTGCSNTSTGYTFFSSQNVSVAIGGSFNYTIVNGPSWSEWYSMFIDFNADGDFTDPNEQIFATTSKVLANGVITGTVNIPASITPAISRIRIRCAWSPGPTSSCGYTAGGEAEDYSITFLTPCTGQPSAGTITGSNVACASATHNLALNGYTIASGITYQWQSSPLGANTFTNIGTNSPNLSLNVTTPTDFRCIVTCVPNGLSATTQVFSVTVDPFYFCYCKNNLGGNTTASIERVRILETPLDNASPGTAPNSYTQYQPTGNKTAALQAGNMYSFSVTYGGYATGSAWLDANRNGTFETNEWIQLNTSGKLATGNFVVPPNAQPGLTGLRIRSQTAGSAATSSNACTNFGSGETEDYVVDLLPGAANDLRLFSLETPASSSNLCPFKDIPITAVIHNNGASTQTNIQVHAKLSGTLTNSYIYNFPGTLAPYTSAAVVIGTFNLPVPGPYTMKAYVTSSVDDNHSNDTSFVNDFSIDIPPTAPAVFNDTVCLGKQADVTVFSNGLIHKWYDSYTGGSQVFTGDVRTYPSLMANDISYVSASFPGDTLTTVKNGTVTCAGGIMFDILPNVNVTIDSFRGRFNGTGAQPVNIYYRQGSYAGYETNPGMWTQHGTTVKATPVSTAELTTIVPSDPLQLAAGITWGIYLEYEPIYSSGGGTYSNNDLAITTGAGLCSSFGGVNAGRTFNGTVYYHQGNTSCPSERTTAAAILGAPPLVQLGKDIHECEGRTITLNAYNSGLATYDWSTGANTPSINVTTAGKYWVTVDRYCKVTDSVNITLDPLPTVQGITFVRSGNTYSFGPTGLQHTVRVLWIFGDGATDTNAYTQHTYPTGDNYKVTLIAFNDCGSDTVDMVLPVSVKDVDRNDLVTVYPNPARDILNIKAEGAVKIGDVIILNAVGAVVYQIDHVQQSRHEVNTSNLPSGHYIIRMKTSEGVINRPFEIIR